MWQRGHLYLGGVMWQIEQREVRRGSGMVVVGDAE